MKVFVAADYLVEARDWLASSNCRQTLLEMSLWAKGRESNWGECFIFVEMSFPAFGRMKATNVDLVVAFSDRVAVCETKNHRTAEAAHSALLASLGQCRDNASLISSHLSVSGVLDGDSSRPFLFLPQINDADVAALVSKQFSTSSLRHVALGGGDSCVSKPLTEKGHPLHFALALRMRLEQIRPLRTPYRGNAQAFLLNLVGENRKHEFDDLQSAIDYVASEAYVTPELRLPTGHVSGLRDESVAEAVHILETIGTLEVLGAFGVGKSSFIRETLNSFARRAPARVRIGSCEAVGLATYRELLASLLRGLDVSIESPLDELYLADRLLATDGIAWVTSYDSSTETFVRQLWEEARRLTGQRRCRLVIESRAALDPDPWSSPDYRIYVGMPRAEGLARILKTAQPDADDRLVSRLSDAMYPRNPLVALARLRSRNQSEEPEDFQKHLSWFEDVFQGFRREMAGFLVYLLDASPITLRSGGVLGLAFHVFERRVPEEVTRVMFDVIRELGPGGMIAARGIDSTRSRHWGFPEINESILKGNIHSLALHVRRTCDKETWSRLTARVFDFFERCHTPLDLRVTLYAQMGDLEPFCSSSFRRGYYGAAQLVPWIEAQRIEVQDVYLERFCRFAESLFGCCQRRETPPDVDFLSEPSPESDLQRHLWQVVSIVSSSFGANGPDLSKFFRAIQDITNANARTEALCWISNLATWYPSRADDRGYLELLAESATQELNHQTRVHLLASTIRRFQFAGPPLRIETWQWQQAVFREYFTLAVTTDDIDLWDVNELLSDVYRPFRYWQDARDLEFALATFTNEGNTD